MESSLEELAALLEQLPKRCAVVLDTAHAWAAGYDLGGPGVMETPKDSAWADERNLVFLRRLQRQMASQASGLTPESACASFSKSKL